MSNTNSYNITQTVNVEADTLEEALFAAYECMFMHNPPTVTYYNLNTGEHGEHTYEY